MRIIVALAATLALSSVARADATFCLNATPNGGVKQEACWAIPDAALGDLIEAYAASYFPTGVVVTPAVTAEDGTVTPAVVRAPTPAEVLSAMGNGIKGGVLANVISYKKAKAAAAASATVTDIAVTPR